MRIFGFEIKRPEDDLKTVPSFVPRESDDGALSIAPGGAYGTYMDLDGSTRSEPALINKYREMASNQEVDSAIQDIVNQSIVQNPDVKTITLNLDDTNFSEKIKDKIREEFEYVQKLLNFNMDSYRIFYRWYVDGRLYYHVVTDPANMSAGIKELRYVDPRKMRKVRELRASKQNQENVMPVIDYEKEYYIFSNKGFQKGYGGITSAVDSTAEGIKIAKDSILYVPSGYLDKTNTIVISHLHKAIKPLNNLRAMEDAVVIYRICLVADTRIKTEAGTKYIKDIEAGDKVFVFTTNGLELAPVKTKWMTGVKPVFKVKTKHFSVTGTDTHPILVHSKLTNVVTYVPISKLDTNIHSVVYEKNNSNIDNLISLIDFRTNVVILKNPEIWSSLDTKGKEDIIINTASDLDIKKSSVRNFLYGQQYIDEVTAFSILETLSLKDQAVLETQKQYYSQNQINLPKYIDEDFAELFGFLIGDGCISDNTITFAEGTDPAQNQYYANLLTRYFGDCKRQNSNTRTYSNWTVSSTLGSKLLQDLGYIRGAKNKRIPEWVFLASDNVKSAFIRGLANADGHIIDDELSGKWHCEIELCNKRLVEDIKDLWTDLGMCSGQIRYRQRKASTIQGHDVVATESWTVFLSNNQIPSFEKISSVDYVGEEEVYDIEVDHEKHNFIANGIVVHNSRAPERRIFYIDVGNLPKPKAEQYMNEIMTKFKNKLVYDATTGEIRDDRKFMCYALDTKIPLLDGRTLTISDIIEEYNNGKTNWVYSCDPVTGKFVPGPISWAGITKHNSDVVRVTFDNGKSVICTPDHKFPVWGKGFIEAQNLSIGESLIPGYRRTKEISTDGVEYEQIFKNDTKTWEFTHREVARYKKDIGLEENLVHDKKYLDNKKSVIHHKDFDRYNNNPENLVMMNHKDIFDAVDYRNNIKRDYGSVGYHAELLNNHKVISVERLDEKMTVAALTIDQEETYHSHHTYLLDAGVYTKNTMLEDFWLPRREGGRGTEISTLPAGQNLGELADVEYFQRLLYKSLNVPSGRLDSNQTFNLGRGAEISRDEDKFSDFVTRLRLEFSLLFKDALERQLILKNVIKVNEWDDNVQSIHVRYADNSYYAEIRENEIINMRAETLAQLDDYVGVYFSRNWVMKKVLHMTEDDIKLMQQEIDAERSSENERNLGNSLDNLNIQTIVHKKAQEDGVVIDPNSGEVMPPQMIPPPPEPPDPAKTNNTPKK